MALDSIVRNETAAPGATPAEWAHWQSLDLTADMLPVISDLTVPFDPRSQIRHADGKTPSTIDAAGSGWGIAGWPTRCTTAREAAQWSAEPRYGIGLIGRRLKAIDIDVENPKLANSIRQAIELTAGALPCRSRSNSGKCMLLFFMSAPMAKTRIKVAAGAVVELLGERQQFLLNGTHKSGVRYEWLDGLPAAIPELTPADVAGLVDAITAVFGVEDEAATRDAYVPRDPVAGDGNDIERDRVIAMWEGMHGERADGRIDGLCPWADEHSDGGAEFAMYIPAAYKGQGHSGWRCMHAHCDGRNVHHFLARLGVTAEATRAAFDVVVLTEAEADAATAAAISNAQLRARFTPSPWHAFAAGPSPAWLVRGVLPQAELAVIYGESGSGKTFFALDLVAAVARGVEWRGRRVKLGRVVYICAEGAGGFRNRVKAYARVNKVEHDSMQLDVIADAPDMLGDDHKALAARIGSAAVVVVDTLAQTTPGANENSGEDMGKAIAHCKALHRATGALIVLIHHSGKDATRGARGWSGIKAACDAEIEVVRAKGSRLARISKQKDGEDGGVLPFALSEVVVGSDDEGDVTSCTVVVTDMPPNKREDPKGDTPLLAWLVAQELLGGAECVPEESLVVQVVARMPEPAEGAKDRRRDNAKRAIAGLIENGYMFREADELAIF